MHISTTYTELDDPDEWLFSWGYHRLWHGELSRAVLDQISSTRPIGVWQRSCHEFFLNSAAIAALAITADEVAEALVAYYDLGVRSLLIRGYDPLPDAVAYGEELIPRVRALVAARDAG